MLLTAVVALLLAPAGEQAAAASPKCDLMRGQATRGSSAAGLFVVDAGSGRVLCRRAARKSRILASNTKLFTTATALGMFGPRGRLRTRLLRNGPVDRRGVLRGSLFLEGGGDPALGSPAFYDRFTGLGTNLFGLRAKARRAGIRQVTGRLFADDTVFDRLRGVADSSYATSPWIGPLSGLSFNSGHKDSGGGSFASDPARVAASKLARSMRKAGISISPQVGVRKAPPRAGVVGVVRSPTMADLVERTNVVSDNFFAEMLLKAIGARFGGGGTTGAGAKVVERFARRHGSAVQAVDGSGLTRSNRASPAQVGRFLAAMRRDPAWPAFLDSLAVAGREGTVDHRMEGTPAAGRCRVKTGTLSGVSALSGYCLARSGRTIAFSALMNGVYDLSAAHRGQDRIAAIVARY